MAETVRTTRLADVARAAGVSIATASRSLNGAPGVSEQLATKIRQLADDLGYVANPHARSLAGGTSTTVGVVVHQIDDPYFAEVAAGLIRAATAAGWQVSISQTERDSSSEGKLLRSLRSSRLGAVVMAGSGYTDPELSAQARAEIDAMRAEGVRVVVVGRHQVAADAVLPNSVAAGRAIAQLVLELGHRHCAVLSGDREMTTVADRLLGMDTAFRGFGLNFTDGALVEAQFNHQGGYEAAGTVLSTWPETTALLCVTDDMAIGAMRRLREAGVAMPEQMSIAGIDDIRVAGDLSPALTTVHMGMAEIGAAVFDMITQPELDEPRRQVMPARLVRRASTAPPRPT